ncbi:hypothetical protein [Streptacidiphilus sp. MAP12-33]|uniref:hypothetical protein n=1 Tax=Streptacidiphilus sp. MAP12-33 TaxID=3156266 RepID=UPI0035167FEE
MGYDVRITRAGSQLRSAEHPISAHEWQAVLDEGLPKSLADAEFICRAGQIRTGAYTVDLAALVAVARRLGARLLGDDDEEYLPDGSSVQGDPRLRPNLLTRPLAVDEVAEAWRSLLSWEDCLDGRSVSAQAWAAFSELALRDVASPGADRVLVRAHADESGLSLVLAREFTPGRAEQRRRPVRIACTLRYAEAACEAFASSHALTEGGMQARRAWLYELVGRPEWAVLDGLVPTMLAPAGEEVFNSRIRARYCPTNK